MKTDALGREVKVGDAVIVTATIWDCDRNRNKSSLSLGTVIKLCPKTIKVNLQYPKDSEKHWYCQGPRHLHSDQVLLMAPEQREIYCFKLLQG